MLRTDSQNPQTFAQNQIRKRIQHYSFFMSDKIGRGYSSNVYKGMNDRTKQQVAIKVIELKSLKDEVTKNLLRMELQCIKKIDHPHILKCFSSYETVNNCYIITEYCEGGDLDKFLRKKGKFSEKQLHKFFHQFYDAYLHFWESGYIHRDLKPANILLRDENIKIADFGFVKRARDPPKNSYNVGTPVYMPPESLNQNIYTQKSDIWAMGVICYQLIHGRVPWHSNSEHQLKNKIKNEKPLFDRNLISGQLQDFIQKCLTVDPQARISLSQIKEHPWFLKQINSQNSQQLNMNMRIPLADITNRITIQQNKHPKTLIKTDSTNQFLFPAQIYKKQSITERPTIDSIHSHPERRDSKKQQKTSLQSVITILNFLRFVYKVYKFVQESQHQHKNQMSVILGKLVLKELEMHEGILECKLNKFGVWGWQTFVQSKKWKIYKQVVNQYSNKYRKTIFKDPNPISKHSSIKQLLHNQHKSIKKQISSTKSNNQQILYRQIQLLDYLVTLDNLYKLLEQHGWMGLIEKSEINLMVEHQCKVSSNNYQQVWRQLSSKINQFY